MNLVETERLIRKLADVLQSRVPPAQAVPLAQAYADLCRTVNHRLEQCAGMLSQGDEHQALQLAEAPPPVLELASRLAFRESSQWREFCQKHNLPVPEPLEGAFIRQLSGAYGRGITADHALYRDYRQAVLLHQDESAVKALRSIAWRNPADANAPRELERLERKILRERLDKLAAALNTGDDSQAVVLVKQIESLNFQARPGGEVWSRGQAARCRALLAEARAQRAKENWADAAALLNELRALLEEHHLELPEAAAQELGALEEWVADRYKQALEKDRFERAMAELRRMLATHEERQMAGDIPGRLELRQDLEELRHKWKEVELAGRPLGEELPAQVRKSEALFETRLIRLDRRRRIWAITSVVVFALAVVIVCLVQWNRRAAGELSSELNSLRAGRQVVALEKRAAQVRSEHPHLAAKAPVKDALVAADDLVAQERQKVRDAEPALSELETIVQGSLTNLAADQVEARFTVAAAYIEAVSKDFRRDLHDRLLVARGRFDSWLDLQRNQRAAEFVARLGRAEENAKRDLRYDRGPEAVRAALASLAPQLSELQEQTRLSVTRLAPPAEAQARLKALEQHVQTLTAELAKWDEIHAVWKTASSLEAYLDSLKTFQHCEFADPTQIQAAGQLLAADPTVTALLSTVLLPGQTEAWAQFRNQPSLRLQPDDVMPAERSKIRELRDDENIHSVQLCREILKSLPAQDRDRTRVVYLRGQWENTRSALQRGVVYDPQESPELLHFYRQQFISNVEFEDLGRAPEADAFESVGCRQLLDASGTNFGQPLLNIFDQINRETKSSALFRAWLTLRLGEVFDLRPNDWGAAWAPALATDRERLRASGAESLRSGDWLVPARKQAYATKLEQYFQSTRSVSYLSQARFLYALDRRIADTGFALAGHVDAAGKPALSGVLPPGTELWGWAAGTRSPARLFKLDKEGKEWASAQPALPFSPLLVFRAEAKQLLASVKRSQPTSEIGSWLPPLFEAKE